MPGFCRAILTTAAIIMFTMVVSSTSTSSSKITISPKNVYDYGDVIFGHSATNDFVFSNKTDVNIEITSSSITGTNQNQFTITVGGSTTQVSPGGTHTITVKFTPTGGKATAILRVNYKDENNNSKEISVDLKGNSIDSASLSVNVTGTPPTYDYGAIASGQTKTHTFKLSNTGNADLKITDVTINHGAFMITAGYTPGSTEILHDGESLDVYIQFSPTTVGPIDAILSIEHNAGNVASPYEIHLKGAGGSKTFETDVTGNPLTIDFGKVYANVAKNRIKISIWNTGFDALELSNITFSDPAVFSIISGWSGTPVYVTTNTLELVIQFAPNAVKSYDETMSIDHNGVNITSPAVFKLLGEGTTNYNAEKFAPGYTPLTSGTYVLLKTNEFKSAPIGFTFNYYGNTYDTVYISSKGYIGFGPDTTGYATPAVGHPLPSTSTPNNVIMLFNSDLDPNVGGSLRYKVEGVAPDRTFILHILDLETRNSSTPYNTVSGQIILYETTNVIELCYPTSGINWPGTPAIDILIGLENIDGSKGVNYNGVDPNPVTSAPIWNIRYK